MKNNLRLSWSDLKDNPAAVLSVGYKLIFLPYAVIFLFYVIASVLFNAAAFYFGVPIQVILYIYVPLLVIAGLALFTFRLFLRKVSNSLARRKSLNPGVAIFSESNTLHFLADDKVRYGCAYVVRPRAHGISRMQFVLEWNGNPQTVRVESADGCSAAMQARPESSGILITADFGRTLAKNVIYTFEYTFVFDNSNKLIKRFLRKIAPYVPEHTLSQTLVLEDKPQRRFIEAVYTGWNTQKAIVERFVVSEDHKHTSHVHRPVQGFSYKLAAQSSE